MATSIRAMLSEVMPILKKLKSQKSVECEVNFKPADILLLLNYFSNSHSCKRYDQAIISNWCIKNRSPTFEIGLRKSKIQLGIRTKII